jgi:hypothetical protein
MGHKVETPRRRLRGEAECAASNCGSTFLDCLQRSLHSASQLQNEECTVAAPAAATIAHFKVACPGNCIPGVFSLHCIPSPTRRLVIAPSQGKGTDVESQRLRPPKRRRWPGGGGCARRGGGSGHEVLMWPGQRLQQILSIFNIHTR